MIPTLQGFRWLEGDLIELFKLLTEGMLTLNALTLSITKYSDGDGKPDVSGFYHIGNDCFMFDNVRELFDAYKSRQILFQKFEGWKNRVKRERKEADLNATHK